jgi:hypothetical protein
VVDEDVHADGPAELPLHQLHSLTALVESKGKVVALDG